MIAKCPICGRECVDTGTGLIGCTNRSCGYQVLAKRQAEHKRASLLTWCAVDRAKYSRSEEELDALERALGFVRNPDGSAYFTMVFPGLTEAVRLELVNVISNARDTKGLVDRTAPKKGKEAAHE